MVLSRKINDSFKELKNTKSLVVLGLLTAVYVVLSFYNFYPIPTLRITFTFIPLVLASAMFGPVCGAFMGVLGDVLSYITSQSAAGAFNFGFTINAFVIGFVYGMLLYKSDMKVSKIIIAKLILAVLVELILTPIWLSMLYGKSFIVLILDRIVKTLVFIPIEVIIINFIVKKIYKYIIKEL